MSRDIRGLTDRELLLILCDDMDDLKREIMGNGQPGVLQRLSKVETKVEERTSKAPPLAAGGAAGALITILIAWLRHKGLPV